MRHYRHVRRLTVACVIFFVLPCPLIAHAADREYAIKAVFLYNFLNYIKWPDQPDASGTPEVRLCIVGKDPFGDTLTAIRKKISAEWNLRIVHIAIDQPLPDTSCHIVFISRLEPAHAVVSGSLSSAGVLTVSDIEGFAENTGIVEFAQRKDKIRLIINVDRLKEANLKASSKLMKISEIVKSGN